MYYYSRILEDIFKKADSHSELSKNSQKGLSKFRKEW